MLIEKGAAAQYAVASTFIIRAVTLWFAVLMVLSVFLYIRKNLEKYSLNQKGVNKMARYKKLLSRRGRKDQS